MISKKIRKRISVEDMDNQKDITEEIKESFINDSDEERLMKQLLFQKWLDGLPPIPPSYRSKSGKKFDSRTIDLNKTNE